MLTNVAIYHSLTSTEGYYKSCMQKEKRKLRLQENNKLSNNENYDKVSQSIEIIRCQPGGPTNGSLRPIVERSP